MDWVVGWKKAEFLVGVKPHFGSISVTQVFRKHPIYRLWFNWFQKLNDFKEIQLEVKDRLPLKDTYQLYEIWCFMQIVKILREFDLLEDTTELFTFQDDQYYLYLSENKESVMKLKNGAKLTYQKIIQSNTKPYYSYTQRMIPDIVIEHRDELYILDPKYRVSGNLPMALGEMHKYRDGILKDGRKVVKEVYILTPQKSAMSDEKDFYSEDYQQNYKMGAFCMKPGEDPVELKKWLEGIFEVN